MVLAMSRTWIVLLVTAGLLMAACSANRSDTSPTQVNPALENAIPPDVALNVQNQISATMGFAVKDIQLKQVEKKDWPNSCLGLPEGNEACAQVVTPGWLLTFNISGKEYKYRVDQTGNIIRQEP
jgi:hypothetical protein